MMSLQIRPSEIRNSRALRVVSISWVTPVGFKAGIPEFQIQDRASSPTPLTQDSSRINFCSLERLTAPSSSRFAIKSLASFIPPRPA